MCNLTPMISTSLAMDDTAPRRSRELLLIHGCSAHNAAVFDEAELLVSELATNAVRHGCPPITLCIECNDPDGLEVCVSDGAIQSPTVREFTNEAESGRGMALVDILSDDWGVDICGAGKDVWFRMAGKAVPSAS